MTASSYSATAEGNAGADGNVSFTFIGPPTGLTTQGTIAIVYASDESANPLVAATWVATLAHNPIGSWVGTVPFGPVTIQAGQTLVVSSTNGPLVPGSQVQAVLIGSSQSLAETQWLSPTPSAPGFINLTPGTTVDLTPGSTVGLAPGTTVGITPGATAQIAIGGSTRWKIGTFSLTSAAAVLLIAAIATTASVVITNQTVGQTIYVANDALATIASAGAIPPGAGRRLDVTASIWVFCPTASAGSPATFDGSLEGQG